LRCDDADFERDLAALDFIVKMLRGIGQRAVAHIHTEHFLEHLEYSDGQNFLRECYRVLEIGGTMRVVVPDSEKYMFRDARTYSTQDWVSSNPEIEP